MAANGGIIGPVNTISAGKNKVTSKLATGAITTQANTTLVDTLVVAGGGAGGAGTANTGGGGGGGGNPSPSGPSVGGNGGSGVVIIRYKFQ